MWRWDQRAGKLFDAANNYKASGYAGGNCGKNPEGINNHDLQNVKSVGPLPVGNYTFGKLVAQSHLGPFAIELIPDAANEMFGRGGFFIHGDTTPSGRASEGCIILGRIIRNMLWNSTDHVIQVF